jgi:hypothetical protein
MAEHLHGYPQCETPAGKPCPPTDLNYLECQSHGSLVSCAPSVVDGIPTGQYHCLHANAPAPKAKPKPKAKAKPKKAAAKPKGKPKKAARKAPRKAAKKAKGKTKGKKKKAGQKKKK